MSTDDGEFFALQSIIQVLQPFDQEDRGRILSSAALFLGIESSRGESGERGSSRSDSASIENSRSPEGGGRSNYPAFSTQDPTTPKAFLFDKQPRSDVERIAVLAFYLTHYRDMPHFKTLDLSKLNTEAAQPKFANTANSASNAVKQGYLVASTKGMRQLSAVGERFVAALPDREAARATMSAAARPKRRPQRKAVGPQARSGQGKTK
jgi:hypothetical protein